MHILLIKLKKKKNPGPKCLWLLAHGRWFSPGSPASSTTKTGRHDIAEILLKVELKHQKFKIKKNQNLINNDMFFNLIILGCFGWYYDV